MTLEGRVALCVARFYVESGGQAGDRERERRCPRRGSSDVDRFDVPGAFELPLAAKYAAQSGRYVAVVCLGAVIRGETDHYDYVCGEAARGIQQVQLETGDPVRLRGADRGHDGAGARSRGRGLQARHGGPRGRGGAGQP